MGMPLVIVLKVLLVALVRLTDRTLQFSSKDGIKVVAKCFVVDLERSWA